MGDIKTVLLDMDTEIRGQTICNCDGSYTIFINAKLNYETQSRAYLHELMHIKNGDFEKYDVDKTEYYAHKEEYI